MTRTVQPKIYPYVVSLRRCKVVQYFIILLSFISFKMSLETSFRGKRVFVTGVGRGIGREVVKRLYSYGAVVVGLGKNIENLKTLKEECPGVETIVADLRNWDETRVVLSKIEPVDYLLNNAGIGMVKSLMHSSIEEFEQIYQVNVKGTFNVTQIVAQKMVDAGKAGSICFISSICGGKPFPLFGAYCMSKSALEMLANCMAVELGPKKIRVNIIRPACVNTDLLNIAETGVGSVFEKDDAFQQFMVSRTPYPGYHMEMESLINLILFTLSNLSPQVTGSVVTIDGGFQLS